MFYFQSGFKFEFMKFSPALLAVSFSCIYNTYYIELKEKISFLENIQSQILEKDLKTII